MQSPAGALGLQRSVGVKVTGGANGRSQKEGGIRELESRTGKPPSLRREERLARRKLRLGAVPATGAQCALQKSWGEGLRGQDGEESGWEKTPGSGDRRPVAARSSVSTTQDGLRAHLQAQAAGLHRPGF